MEVIMTIKIIPDESLLRFIVENIENRHCEASELELFKTADSAYSMRYEEKSIYARRAIS
jgi:hypothetical protein